MILGLTTLRCLICRAMDHPELEPADEECDVLIIGGALSGSSSALLLKQRDPNLRVVVVEKNTAFKRRVGEATTEVSSFFLTRVLGLTGFLAQTQISKNGLRFWYSHKGKDGSLADCSEIGGRYLSTVPAYLIDRSVLDEEILSRASAAGAQILRPASVTSVELREGKQQRVSIRQDGRTKTFLARWVIDASGVKCQIARENDWLRSNEAHPTMAVWTRWRGTRDWDAPEIASAAPDWSKGFYGIRGTATNHFVGEGWWAWWIQLKGGDVSIGAVIDQRLIDWERNAGTVGEKLRAFLAQHPAAREMMKGAEFVEGDVHFRRNLPYFSDRFAGDGFALVGDASAFIDPLYSPGMDWIAYTVFASVELILKCQAGEEAAPLIAAHNRDFSKSYARMFEALYQNKYEYLGDFDLMRVAFRLDIASYYLYVARFLYQSGPRFLAAPPFSPPQAGPFFWLMRLYNRRLAAMARSRRERGVFGSGNTGNRDLVGGFNFRLRPLFRTAIDGLCLWFSLECREGWRSWGKTSPKSTRSPEPTPSSDPVVCGEESGLNLPAH